MKKHGTEIFLFRLTIQLFLLYFLTGCAVQTQASGKTAFNADDVVAALQAGECNRVWQLTWQAAKSSNDDATLILADAIYSYGLTPPGMSGNTLYQLRSTMTLYAEVAKTGNSYAADMLAGLLKSDIFAEAKGKEHAACLEKGVNLNTCIDNVLATGVFPSFSQLASEIDIIGRETKGNAKCTRIPENRLMKDSDFDVLPDKK
jgi:hypothetical protein